MAIKTDEMLEVDHALEQENNVYRNMIDYPSLPNIYKKRIDIGLTAIDTFDDMLDFINESIDYFEKRNHEALVSDRYLSLNSIISKCNKIKERLAEKKDYMYKFCDRNIVKLKEISTT